MIGLLNRTDAHDWRFMLYPALTKALPCEGALAPGLCGKQSTGCVAVHAQSFESHQSVALCSAQLKTCSDACM